MTGSIGAVVGVVSTLPADGAWLFPPFVALEVDSGELLESVLLVPAKIDEAGTVDDVPSLELP